MHEMKCELIIKVTLKIIHLNNIVKILSNLAISNMFFIYKKRQVKA